MSRRSRSTNDSSNVENPLRNPLSDNGSVGSSSLTKDDEQQRRQAEISLFAAMALGDPNVESAVSTTAALSSNNDTMERHRGSTSSQSVAAAGSFGAMASDSSGTFAFDSKQAASPSPMERSNLQAALAALENEQATSLNSAMGFSAGSGPLPSSPFPQTLAKSSLGSSASSSVLSGLTSTASHANPFSHRTSYPNSHAASTNHSLYSVSSSHHQNHRDFVSGAPMTLHEVVLHRPLFFGAMVPPRVLREARRMVVEAYHQLGYDPDHDHPPHNDGHHDQHDYGQGRHRRPPRSYHHHHGSLGGSSGRDAIPPSGSSSSSGSAPRVGPPRLEELPGSVRNLVATLRVLGYGWDVCGPHDPEHLNARDDDDDDDCDDRDMDDSETTHGDGDGMYKHKDYLHPLNPLADARRRRRRRPRKQPRQKVTSWAQGSSAVTTFQPLWSTSVRQERRKRTLAQRQKDQAHAQNHQQRPPPVSARSSTAPARLLEQLSKDNTSSFFNDWTNSPVQHNQFHHQVPDNADDEKKLGDYPGSEPSTSTFVDKPEGLGHAGSAPASSDLHTSLSPDPNRGRQNRPFAASEPAVLSNDNKLDANAQFSAWLRGGTGGGSFSASSGAVNSVDPSANGFQSPPRRSLWHDQGENGELPANNSEGSIVFETPVPSPAVPKQLTEQELFSQWARGESGITAAATAASGSMRRDQDSYASSANPFASASSSSPFLVDSNTFQRRPPTNGSGQTDSDDDSVEHDERKKQVGVNDHLSKALASLTATDEKDDFDDRTNNTSLLTAAPPEALLLDNGTQNFHADGDGGPPSFSQRPWTNFELSRGCVPIYGVDDPPIPVEGDLGIHETKEDQQRSQELKRSQEMVEKFVHPNLFGTLSNPSPALSSDDFHSWNSRGSGAASSTTTSTPRGHSMPSPTSQTLEQQQSPASLYHHHNNNTNSTSAILSSSNASQSGSLAASAPGTIHSASAVPKTPAPMGGQGNSTVANSTPASGPAGNSNSVVTPSSAISSNAQTPRAGHHQPQQQHQDESGRPPRSSSKLKSSMGLGGSKRYAHSSSRMRYGWWNVGDPKEWPATITKPGNNRSPRKSTGLEGTSTAPIPASSNNKDSKQEQDHQLHVPPVHHPALACQVVTPLEPTPGQLRQGNMPLSRMDAATSMAQSLPYLSDRPPSHRYLQIDTQAVGFPPIGVEIEPLFCSLAIYNIETTSSVNNSGNSNSSGNNTNTSPTAGHSSNNGGADINSFHHNPGGTGAPLPDLQRCGRVTEVLNFDVYSDADVGRRCEAALWPYDASSPFSRALDVHEEQFIEHSRKLVGTRCGVFPLPSNLNFANLYAVLLVKKVLSEDPLDPYLKQGYKVNDAEKLRANAEKASQRQSAFLLPFAFGVAPLLQVFGGTESPVVTSSRAVQIPLFRFSPGQGDRQIIDHVMVMLSPRDQRTTTGPVAATNGGTAMLVMRNFGYLGLHQVVDKSSTLARDRLVDFSGELQIRRNDAYDPASDEKNDFGTDDVYRTITPGWKQEFLSEPVEEGGRCLVAANEDDISSSPARSSRYAQELLPVRLQLTPTLRLAQQQGVTSRSGRMYGQDIEPFYHTCFCNEMLVQPRLLHNCPKGNVVVKAELREIEWNENTLTYFAHLPRRGPSFHNNRRGPFLVQSVLTSCVPRGSDKHFMDEFKLKLPLDLQPQQKKGAMRTLCILFTVYHVKMSSKSKWKRAKKLFTGVDGSHSLDSQTVSRVERIASGFLPISRTGGIIDDGLHDVRIIYSAQTPPQNLLDMGLMEDSTLVLIEKSDMGENLMGGREHSYAEDTTVSNDSGTGNEASRTDTSNASVSDLVSNAEDSVSRSEKGRGGSGEPISLSVRICVHSSLHAQNPVLSEFLRDETDSHHAANLNHNAFLSKISMGREFLVNNSLTAGKTQQEERLLRSTMEIVKYNLCPVTRSHSFLFRAMHKLWKTLILGTGEANVAWSNPGAPIPLRLHAFASILQLLGGTSLYLTKNGVTQVDGVKWNVVVLGRIVALFFDERALFGETAKEAIDADIFQTPDVRGMDKTPERKYGISNRRTRHVRQNIDIFEMNSRTPQASSELSMADTPPTKTVTRTRRLSIPPRLLDDEKTSSKTIEIASLSDQKRELRVDSKSDFQSALRAATAAEDDFDRPESDGSKAATAMIQAFGGLGANNRRWMTAPSRALTTIRENENDLEDPNVASGREDSAVVQGKNTASSGDVLDDELVINPPKRSVKQMRIPRARKSNSSFDFSTIMPESTSSGSVDSSSKSLPKSDDDIETAGTAFLDVIGKSLGLSAAGGRGMATEEQRVGSSYHRKTKSRSSIDWTLLGIGDGLGMDDESEEAEKDVSIDQNEGPATLKSEECTTVVLPDFAERLATLEQSSSYQARWFPYAYEVIILQWAAILLEQRAIGERPPRSDRSRKQEASKDLDEQSTEAEGVTQAATRSIGVAVAGAPLLFEVIKQSLGFRIMSLFHESLRKKQSGWTSPPLVSLDETLTLGLEQVLSMVADACIDSRNFDSWDLRQMSIDVNDSIVRFLRDMFSFLAPKTVHRLVLAYLSRFVTKDGKHWQDRDSTIGLRCSWEITKLRLNAITGLIRFPDFIRVNGPQMLNWTNWWMPSFSRSDSFYDEILARYRRFRLPVFAATEGNSNRQKFEYPGIHPHWLSEIAVDICLLGVEHAEPQIQQRSAALIHEMFWISNREGIVTGRIAPIASMHISFLWKMLSRTDYLSNFAPKSQLRKDLLPCVVYILQSTPGRLVRALWRQLCKGLPGKGLSTRYGGFTSSRFRHNGGEHPAKMSKNTVELKEEPDVLEMFTLLNLSLRTVEFEGSEEHLEKDGVGASRESVGLWQKEYLLAKSQMSTADARSRRKLGSLGDRRNGQSPDLGTLRTSTVARRWFSHDASLVIVNATHQIVWELYSILSSTGDGSRLLNPAVKSRHSRRQVFSMEPGFASSLKHSDIAVFVRAAASVYLHALALRQSDIVVVRTFKVSAELIKIFGIKTFLESLGETLQHWMRVISLQCGARRAYVRIEATDLLELILRSTWECFGSFFRIRVPLLAVQTEVMERIVATAASRYYRDQRRLGATFEPFSNVSAEASLVPLWRTLDRIEKQPASQNVAFRGALIRMAGKLKKLYRAYIAARVLSFIQGSRGNEVSDEDRKQRDHETEALIRANRISILRVINASEGHSKQFLGFHATTQQRSRVAHFEAVEDALINAADVFSPTELPEHRVAWLRMLADFHSSRRKYAEEATCHFHIHVTLQEAARLHGSLWSNTPFLPWTDNMPDPVYITNGDSPTADPDFGSDYDFEHEDGPYGNSINSFRRIFYRVANSVALNPDDWDTGVKQTLFCGITTAMEYNSVSPWVTLRDMEDQMVEEAELAGDLFLLAGIIESSRFAWGLATQYYAQKFNYAKLALAYRHLERTVVSKVPPIDASLPQEVSAILGRFYRVWFHGGAPDELSGVEFVYRTEGGVRLDTFGQELKEVIKSIIPDKTPIHLVLDGRPEERLDEGSTNYSFNRLGPTPLEPVRIKVTPLRPLFEGNSRTRGLPEWFFRYSDEAFETKHHRSKNELGRSAPRSKGSPNHGYDGHDSHTREHSRTYSASVFSSAGSGTSQSFHRRFMDDRVARLSAMDDAELSGVDKFCFVQPKDRSRGLKDWWRSQNGDFAEKTLKVTQLQVAQSFPGCVARQPVVHRLVYTQSPLEAGIDAICQWCSVLFRTAVATVGMAVLGTNLDPGIGTDAVKVVVDCIHSSHVKEIGLALLKKNSEMMEGDASNDLSLESYDRLSDDEVRKLQVKLARLVIVFVELLHLLVARNRQMLLDYMQERKRMEANIGGSGSSNHRSQMRPPSLGTGSSTGHEGGTTGNRWVSRGQRSNSGGSQDFVMVGPGTMPAPSASRPVDVRGSHKRSSTEGSARGINHQRSNSEDHYSTTSAGNTPTGGVRAESAIAVQSELQRAFISMVKSLYPKVQGILQGDTPRWLKQCAQDTYFSLGTYKQTKIPIAEELCYASETTATHHHHPAGNYDPRIVVGGAVAVMESPSPRGSGGGGSNQSVVSRGSDRYAYPQFE